MRPAVTTTGSSVGVARSEEQDARRELRSQQIWSHDDACALRDAQRGGRWCSVCRSLLLGTSLCRDRRRARIRSSDKAENEAQVAGWFQGAPARSCVVLNYRIFADFGERCAGRKKLDESRDIKQPVLVVVAHDAGVESTGSSVVGEKKRQPGIGTDFLVSQPGMRL